jgi:hypothetical protein
VAPDHSESTGRYAPLALDGPYHSVDEWCAQSSIPADDHHMYIRCVPAYEPLVSSGPSHIERAWLVPYDEMFQGGEISPDTSCAIAIQRGGAVWVEDAATIHCLSPPGKHGTYDRITIDEFVWRDVISEAPQGEAIGPELVVRVSSSQPVPEYKITVRKENMIVCGSGASEHPACTPLIPVSEDTASSHRQFRPQISTNGKLSFTIDDPDQTGSRDQATQALVFR